MHGKQMSCPINDHWVNWVWSLYTVVILATGETEVGWFPVQDQPDLHSKTVSKSQKLGEAAEHVTLAECLPSPIRVRGQSPLLGKQKQTALIPEGFADQWVTYCFVLLQPRDSILFLFENYLVLCHVKFSYQVTITFLAYSCPGFIWQSYDYFPNYICKKTVSFNLFLFLFCIQRDFGFFWSRFSPSVSLLLLNFMCS